MGLFTDTPSELSDRIYSAQDVANTLTEQGRKIGAAGVKKAMREGRLERWDITVGGVHLFRSAHVRAFKAGREIVARAKRTMETAWQVAHQKEMFR